MMHTPNLQLEERPISGFPAPDVLLGGINAQIQRRQGNVFEEFNEFVSTQARAASVDPLASFFPVVSLIVLAPIALALAPIALEFAQKEAKKRGLI